MSAYRHWRVPFDGNSRVRWVVVPGLVLAYVPVFFSLYHAAGRVAFGSGLFAAAVAAASSGIGPGILTAALIQSLNFLLSRTVESDQPHLIASASIAFFGSVMLVFATGGLRHLLQRVTEINSNLDEQIRARRRTEERLEENLQLHRSLLATLGEGVGLFDSADRFLFANAAAEGLFGVGPGELVGRTLLEFLTSESQAELSKLREPQGSKPITCDLVLAGDGARVVLVTETRMLQGAAGEPKTLRVLRDVTVRVRLERERRELDQYLQRTQALQSLAVLAGGVAHDFNNLLSGVIGCTDLALIKLGKSPESARDCLEETRRFALEASELSRKMLAYAGKRSVVLEATNLADEVAQALQLVGSAVLGKARLSNTIPRDLPPIQADRTGLHQVVINLVLNAIEAMDTGQRGMLVLHAEVTRVHADSRLVLAPTAPAPGEYVRLSIADTGCGMAKATLDRLFEPFFSTKFQGRGMGLAASLGIVRAHGGSMTVESKLGVGTTFYTYWPLAAGILAAEKSLPVANTLERQGTTLLLVDDEPSVRQVTAQLLEELGCHVLQAGSGREALGIFNRLHERIQLVLLDLTMPEQSGFEVLAALRAIDPESRVILTSGYSMDDSIAPSEQPGVVGFLHKPHSLAGLAAAVQRGLCSPSAKERVLSATEVER